jgi:hypothetical protein
LVAADAGVVTGKVEPAIFVHCRFDHVLAIGGFRHVRADEDRFAACLADFLGRFLTQFWLMSERTTAAPSLA